MDECGTTKARSGGRVRDGRGPSVLVTSWRDYNEASRSITIKAAGIDDFLRSDGRPLDEVVLFDDTAFEYMTVDAVDVSVFVSVVVDNIGSSIGKRVLERAVLLLTDVGLEVASPAVNCYR